MAKKEVKKTSTKNVETKKNNSVKKDVKNNKLLFIIGGIILVLVIVIAIVITLTKSDSDDEVVEEEKIYATEETIESEYGFSKDDAIAVVKEVFQSDNYEFSATIREDNKYIVTVTNTDNGNTYTYVVDPNDGSFSMQEDDE